MGTVFHRTPGLYETILAALRDEPLNLLIALGFDQDPARLGPLPPHVRVQPTLPQVALLPRCALLVSHGGFNSVKEALAEAVPLVIVPIAGDQPYCVRAARSSASAASSGQPSAPPRRSAQPCGRCWPILLPRPGTAHARRSLRAPARRRRRDRARAGRGSARGHLSRAAEPSPGGRRAQGLFRESNPA